MTAINLNHKTGTIINTEDLHHYDSSVDSRENPPKVGTAKIDEIIERFSISVL